VSLDFDRPGGSVTGRLIPTGQVSEILQTEFDTIEVSIVDAANPVVFFRACDLGLDGCELPNRVDSDKDLLARIESIRAAAAVRIGLARDMAEATRNSPAVPKIAFVSPAAEYVMTSGITMPANEIDLVARIMSMGKLHGAYAVTGAICTAGAACIPGTVVNEMITGRTDLSEVRVGHPGGSIAVNVHLITHNGEPEYECATVYRTARRIMDGFVYVPEALR
jgi:2-methylaconitate cis-trans-isomerase PrpF